MRKYLILFTISILIVSCNKKEIVLKAYTKIEVHKDSTLITFFSDSSCILKPVFNRKLEDTIFKGQYKISKDTIFLPKKFKSLIGDKAIIKNGYLHLLNGPGPFKMKVLETISFKKNNMDSLNFRKFSVFTYNGNFYPFEKNSIPYDLKQNEFLDVENIINDSLRKVFNQNFDSKERFKQVVAIKNRNNEVEVYLNCFCKKSIGFDYFFSVVNDGGACYITSRINLTKRKCLSVMINGA